MYASLALNSELEADDYDNKAMDAIKGGDVPQYTIDHVIDSDRGNRVEFLNFIDERYVREGRVLSVRRLPKAKYRALKNMFKKVTGGMVAIGLSGVFILEEALIGKVAESLEEEPEW